MYNLTTQRQSPGINLPQPVEDTAVGVLGNDLFILSYSNQELKMWEFDILTRRIAEKSRNTTHAASGWAFAQFPKSDVMMVGAVR